MTDFLSLSDYHREQSRKAEDIFKNHILREEDDNRWLLTKPSNSGGFRCEFWVEIIAAKNELIVHGDFSPTIFGTYSGRPEEKGDPRALLNWIGGRGRLTAYTFEKARIGMQGLGTYVGKTFEPSVARWECQENFYQQAEGCLADWLLAVDYGVALPPRFEKMLVRGKLTGDETLPEDFCAKVFEKECSETDKQIRTINDYLEIFATDAENLQEFVAKHIADDDLCIVWKDAIESVPDGNTLEEGIQFQQEVYEAVSDYDVDAWESIGDLGFVPQRSVFFAVAACARALELIEERDKEMETVTD